MKILVIGDSHIKISRFELGKAFLSWVNKVASEVKPDLIVNLGDFLDTHAVIRAEILKEYRDHVETCIPYTKHGYFHVLGNHEFYKPTDSSYHALQAFKGSIDGLHIVDKPLETLGISFIPFVPKNSDFPTTTQPTVFAHQTFIGADYGFKKAEDGVDYGTVNADIIISGHIHKRQVLGNGKVVYPGSPYGQDANDINQIKGLMLFNSDKYSYSYIDCPLPNWRKAEFTISEGADFQNIIAELQANFTSSPKDHWLIELTGNKADVSSLMGSKEFNRVKGLANPRIKTRYLDSDKRKEKVKSGGSLEDIVRQYVTNVYDGAIDKSKVIETALEIVQQVKTS